MTYEVKRVCLHYTIIISVHVHWTIQRNNLNQEVLYSYFRAFWLSLNREKKLYLLLYFNESEMHKRMTYLISNADYILMNKNVFDRTF